MKSFRRTHKLAAKQERARGGARGSAGEDGRGRGGRGGGYWVPPYRFEKTALHCKRTEREGIDACSQPHLLRT